VFPAPTFGIRALGLFGTAHHFHLSSFYYLIIETIEGANKLQGDGAKELKCNFSDADGTTLQVQHL